MKIPDWLHFRLWIEIPFISVHTCAMKQVYEREIFMYYEISIKIWKWLVVFEIGKQR